MFECNLPELFQIPRQTLLKFRKFHLARTTFHVTRLHEIQLYTAMYHVTAHLSRDGTLVTCRHTYHVTAHLSRDGTLVT